MSSRSCTWTARPRRSLRPRLRRVLHGCRGRHRGARDGRPHRRRVRRVATELGTVTDGSLAVVDDTQAGSWPDVAAGAKAVRRAWSTYAGTDAVPARVAPWMSRALDELERAVRSKDQIATALAAIEVARLGYDLQLRYRPAREVDLDRLRLWAAELAVHAAAGDEGNTGADAFILDYTRDRLVGAMSEDDMRAIDAEVGAIQAAIVESDLAAAGKAASRLQGLAVGPLATG